MKLRMPVGMDDFADVREDCYFVDKTPFLRSFLKNHAKVTLFTRPRRFGKTLTLSMMRYFLDTCGAEKHRRLFDGLAIAEGAEAMAAQGSRPVLFLTLKEWGRISWELQQESIRLRLGDLFSQYDFLLRDDLKARDRKIFQTVLDGDGELTLYSDALTFLLRLLEEHYGRKAVLLIDEYDAPVQAAWEHGYYKESIDFFRRFLSGALKTNPALDFAVLTGVLRIAKENIFSALNNLRVDSVLDTKYPEAFGFTPEDVAQMARDFGREEKLLEIERWYDGYRFAGREIYNPWSVINYFDNDCRPNAYWVNTSGNAILGEMLRHAKRTTMDGITEVLQGGSVQAVVDEGFIYSEIYRNQNALYTMLVTTGYLTTESVTDTGLGQEAVLVLPNREIQSLYRREVVYRYRSDDMDIELIDLMRAFAAGDIETVREGLQEYLEVLTSSFDAAKGKEAFYHGFVLGLTATLIGDYAIRSNRESGYGRYDIAAFPRQPSGHGIVIECKTAESEDALAKEAQAALAQIAEKDYLAELRAQGVEEVLQYGIAFCGKRVQVEMA
ncbi:AAA family ATPase [uncultured Selenomonas sp.]|uniref:AAA family ATPase n=1 Tax=uncultured Selenomonas sp. TaxID=159275 RepID=UPI0025D640D4|nr:AAA family ATPase [uncultured Selenomonas sp.]